MGSRASRQCIPKQELGNEFLANIVKVHGTLSEVEGQKAIYVQTVK